MGLGPSPAAFWSGGDIEAMARGGDMRKRVIRFVSVGLAVAAAWLPARAADLVIPGSGDCEAVLAGLAVAFEKAHPGRKVGVPASTGSTGGVQAVQKNEAVLARIARPLKPDEAKSGLKAVVFGRDAIVFAIGGKVAVSSLTAVQFADVFSGRVTNWRDLGGEPAPIRLVVREESDSTILLLRARLEPFRTLRMGETAKMVTRTQDMLDMLARYKTAIGWATHSAVQAAGAGVRALALDGVSPTEATVASGQYPVAIEYALVFKDERLTAEAREFLAFVGTAPVGAVLRRLGVSPVTRN